MAVTIKDIAKLAGVSTATVSRAFSNHDYVNEETKARILRIAEEQHFAAESLVLLYRTSTTLITLRLFLAWRK